MAKITSEKVRIDYDFDASDYLKRGKWDREKLLEDARKIAKRTNQRIVRLEKAGLQNAPAYKGAEKALTGMYSSGGAPEWASKGGKLRYQESAKQLSKLTNKQLLEMLYSLSRTQQAKTSTPAGAKAYAEIGMKNLIGIAKKYDMELDTVLSIFQNTALKEVRKRYGYNFVMQQIKDIEELILARQEEADEPTEIFCDAVKNVETAEDAYNLTDIQKEIDKILERKKKKVDTTEFFEVV